MLCIAASKSSFNTKAVKVLNEILEKTDADIIVSSDWRNNFTLEQLGEIFEWQGVIKKPIGVTPDVKFTSTLSLERDRAQEDERILDGSST